MSESVPNAAEKSAPTYHPFYFSSFQDYCCGRKATEEDLSNIGVLLPIPDFIKEKAKQIVDKINAFQKDQRDNFIRSTFEIPYEFFEKATPLLQTRYLIDRPMWRTLNEAQIINWFPTLRKLFPVRTSGNGNCLLHAAFIAMTGIHDFDLILRDQLVQYMERHDGHLKESWKAERILTDKMFGIESEDLKLDREWEEIRNLARFDNTEEGKVATSFQYLEGIHVFALSNLLRRPIIVLSEDYVRNKRGEVIGYNDLYGIYLPTFYESNSCHRQPLVFAYDRSHFCPLLTFEVRSPAVPAENCVPLHQSLELARAKVLLRIKFVGKELSTEETNKLLRTYLRVKESNFILEKTKEEIQVTCAELGGMSFETKYNFMLLYYKYLEDYARTLKQQQEEFDSLNAKKLQDKKPTNCSTCKEQDVAECMGCRKGFCSICMQTHVNHLEMRLNDVTTISVELQDKLYPDSSAEKNTSKLSLRAEINQWESEVIEQVQRIAKNLRDNLKNVSDNLDDIFQDMEHKKRRDKHLENDIESIQQKLVALKAEIENINKNFQITKKRLNKSFFEKILAPDENEAKPKIVEEVPSNSNQPTSPQNKTPDDQRPSSARSPKPPSTPNDNMKKPNLALCTECKRTTRISPTKQCCEICDKKLKVISDTTLPVINQRNSSSASKSGARLS